MRKLNEYEYIMAAIDDIPKDYEEVRRLVKTWRMLDGVTIDMSRFNRYMEKAVREGVAVLEDGYYTEPKDHFAEENFIEVDGVVKHKTIEIERLG